MNITDKNFNFTSLFLPFFACIAFILLSWGAVSYLLWPGFLDHTGEINMVNISYLLYNGGTVYTSLDAPERYSLQHGPMVYIIIGSLMHLTEASYFTAKLPAILSLFAVCIISWFWFNYFLDKKTAFYLLGFNVWLMLKWYYLFLSRADSMMLLCIVTGICFATTNRSKFLTVLGVAVPLGILINLKIHSILFGLPILFLIQQRFGWKLFSVTCSLISIIALLPFAHDNISLVNYVAWLNASAGHGISFTNLKGNIGIVVLLILTPGALSLYKGKNFLDIYKQHRYFSLIAILTLLCVAIIGAKHGSGSHHLAPSLPIIMYFLILVLTNKPNDTSGHSVLSHQPGTFFSSKKISLVLLSIIFIIVIFGSLNGQGRLLKYINLYSLDNNIVKDFETLQNKYQKSSMTMMVGYGEKDIHKWYNQLIPLLVFAKNPYFLDNVALYDMSLASIPMPDTTINKLKTGVTKVWLIPKGHSPFSLHNSYNGAILFNQKFRETFLTNYQLANSTEYFDVWVHKEH